MSGDIFGEFGTPKYSTVESIEEGLDSLTNGEEVGILQEMFPDVSWEGQDYLYQDEGGKMKEQFDRLSDYGESMWKMEIALWQIREDEREYSNDVHDLVWLALQNDDMAKRVGFRQIFLETFLNISKDNYSKICEAWYEQCAELDRFDSFTMSSALTTVLEETSYLTSAIRHKYGCLCNAYYKKLRGMKLHEHRECLIECRVLLNAYDDFMFGLKVNQELHTQLEQAFSAKSARLEASYKAAVSQLAELAEQHGIALELPGEYKLLEG